MRELTSPRPSKSVLKEVTAVLGGNIFEDDLRRDADYYTEIFNAAHQFRHAHMYPLHRVRAELRARSRSQEPSSIVVGRLKRMASIRDKLPKFELNEIQDIAGCRTIFSSMKAVDAIAESYVFGNTRHRYKRQKDYTRAPRLSGYRSRHIILQFQADQQGGEYHHNLWVEIQLRTRLQHAWATATEAVDLYTGQDLKGGKGSDEWKRFFALMGSEIALAEGMPLVSGVPTDAILRRRELRHLDEELGALALLEGMRQVAKRSERFSSLANKVMLNFDRETRQLSIRPYSEGSYFAWRYERERQ